MKFTNIQNETVTNTYKKISDIESEKRKYAEYNRGFNDSKIVKDKLAEYDRQIEGARNEGITLLDASCKEFKSTFHRDLKGDELSKDADLLNGTYKISGEDLSSMLARDENKNQTMKRLIHEYAKKNDIVLSEPYYPDNVIKEKAVNYTNFCKSALLYNDYHDIFNNPSQLDRMIPTEIKDI